MGFSSNSSFQNKIGKKQRKNINVFSNIEHKPSVPVHSLNEKLQDKFPEANKTQFNSVPAKQEPKKNITKAKAIRQYDLNNIEEALPAEKRNAKHFHAEGYYSLHYLLKKNQEKYGKELILPENHNLSEKQIREFLQSECELEVSSQIADLEHQENTQESENLVLEPNLEEFVIPVLSAQSEESNTIKQYLFPTEEEEENIESEVLYIPEETELVEKPNEENNINYNAADFPSFLDNKPYTTVNMNAHNLITEKSTVFSKVQEHFPVILFAVTILAGLILFFPDIQVIISKLIG